MSLVTPHPPISASESKEFYHYEDCCCQPVIPGFHPDPSICRVGNDYFLVTSSFEFFPGVPIFQSKDLRNWKQIGHVLTRESQLDLQNAGKSGGIWAPTLRYNNGTYYMITTNVSGRGNFFVTAETPTGPWSDPIWIEKNGEPLLGIDPSLFFDDDGKVYLTLSARRDGPCRISQAELDLRTGKLLTPLRTIWHGTGAHGPEAPHIYKVDGVYYLIIAEGGTEYGHIATMARSNSPWGPWESCPHNPVLTHRSSGSEIHAVGHADLVETPEGEWWGVCLGIRPTGYHRYHVLGRETFRFPVFWREDGWPTLGNAGGLPKGEKRDPAPLLDFDDNFESSPLNLRWTFLRNPIAENYTISENGQGLSIQGSPQNEKTLGSWIGCRQTSHAFEAVFTLSFELDDSGTAAELGLSAYQNRQHHYDVGLKVELSGTYLFTRQEIGQLSQITSKRSFDDRNIVLEIHSDGLRYDLGIRNDLGTFEALDSGDARYLSTETGGMFTGVFLAIFATGPIQVDCQRFRYTSQ